jgi:hypothetical protein
MALKAEKIDKMKEPFQAARAKCAQCGQELRYVPFALNNIMCRECYGLDRYRRGAHTTLSPEKPIEVTATDEDAATAKL